MPTTEMLKSVVVSMLADSPPTPDQIRDFIRQTRQMPMFAEITNLVAEALAREIEELYDTTMELGSVIKVPFSPWYPKALETIDPFYALRYRHHMAGRKPKHMGLPPQVITRINEVTDRICGLLGNPHIEGTWDRRGMVVGNVQSGKTANYTDVVSKAVDAGYRLVIVVAGIHNNLRDQTQTRIDEGFIGVDTDPTKKRPPVGAGLFASREDRTPLYLTHHKRDFHKAQKNAAQFGLKQIRVPGVLVIKKNPSTLRNLIEWVEAQGSSSKALNHAPMLLIDDEADHASINTQKDPDKATRINSQLRHLLSLFSRSSYIGYTATPFANIFINPDACDDGHPEFGRDLFPEDFIVGLEAPTNYFGADRIFGVDRDLDCVRDIEDHDLVLPLKHKIDHDLISLPGSLVEALEVFLLARAIRCLRGDGTEHHSMLVNASRFSFLQIDIKTRLLSKLTAIKDAIRYSLSASGGGDPLIESLYATWKREFGELEFDWDTVARQLRISTSSVEVLAINSKSADRLDYDKYEDTGRAVIAVGGFSLSRGLTLEGLMVSYFLRNSMMYDTLLQMGRWFGYRTGYEDLCRIYMTPDAAGWYEHITEASRELKQEFLEMQQMDRTPREFGLKVRSHPQSLLVTARNKMRAGVKRTIEIGLGSAFIETTRVFGDPTRVQSNIKAGRKLVAAALGGAVPPTPSKNNSWNYLWEQIDVKHVLSFIESYSNHPESLHTQQAPLKTYITRRQDGELANWDIAVINKRRGDIDAALGIDVRCPERTIGKNSVPFPELVRIGNKHRVGDAPMEKLGLTTDQAKVAVAAWKKTIEYADRAKKSGNEPSIPGYVYRKARTRPLLILHLLRMTGEGAAALATPVLAYSISFPSTSLEEETVMYVVNSVWLESYCEYDIDEDDEQEEGE
jgi:hypothetical protein